MCLFRVPAPANTVDMERWHHRRPWTRTDCLTHTKHSFHLGPHWYTPDKTVSDGTCKLVSCAIQKYLHVKRNKYHLKYFLFSCSLVNLKKKAKFVLYFRFFRFGTFQSILRKSYFPFLNIQWNMCFCLVSHSLNFRRLFWVAYPRKGRLNQRAANAVQWRN